MQLSRPTMLKASFTAPINVMQENTLCWISRAAAFASAQSGSAGASISLRLSAGHAESDHVHYKQTKQQLQLPQHHCAAVML